ncbi:MAG TPA: hypothetical protein EYH25_03105, partial [Thermotoga sp.]|nr:hypothetical protein [Thermotoga sp.]
MDGLLLNLVLNADIPLHLQNLLDEKGNVLSSDFAEILKKLLLEKDEEMLKVLVKDLEDLQKVSIDDKQELYEILLQLFQGEVSFEDEDKDRQTGMLNERGTEVDVSDQTERNINRSEKVATRFLDEIDFGIDESKNIDENVSVLVGGLVENSSDSLDVFVELLFNGGADKSHSSQYTEANVGDIGISEIEDFNEDVQLLQSNTVQEHDSKLIHEKPLVIAEMVPDESQIMLENMKDNLVVRENTLEEPRIEKYRISKMAKLLRKHKSDFSIRFGEEHY